MIKRSDGVYEFECGKTLDLLRSMKNSENEEIYTATALEVWKLQDIINDYEKVIKMERENNSFLREVVQNLNKEIREMKEGING